MVSKTYFLKPILIVLFSLGGLLFPLRAENFNHNDLAILLTQFVENGEVDYDGLTKTHQPLLKYLNTTSSITQKEFKKWTEKQQLSFLINVYNAETLQLIIDHRPLKSIRDIGDPWDKPVVSLFGKKITLNYLENEIIRKDYNDARIHFALVCAAKSCPPLRNEPYVANNLEEQLNDQGKKFLLNDALNYFSKENKTMYLSPIFKWFKKDFEKNAPSIQEFIQPYFPQTEKELITSSLKIKYMKYDWSLNEKTSK